MPEHAGSPRTVTLALSTEEQWTLHHVLLDRIEAESAVSEPSRVDPPPVEAFQAFEALDRGETSFTVSQLATIRSVLSEYHHASSWWEIERPRIEQLLHRVSEPIEDRRAAQTVDG